MAPSGAGKLRQRSLLILGFGYSAERIAARLLEEGWRVAGTTRSPDRIPQLESLGVRGLHFGDTDEFRETLHGATELLVSIPPDGGDPETADESDTGVAPEARRDADAGLRLLSPLDRVDAPSLRTIAYLSTTGVYGDRGGDWVHEHTPPSPGLERTRRRVRAEHGWAALAGEHALRSLTFRLSGIYGPGRSVIDRLRNGTARRIVKPDAVSNRIHVDDIALCVGAALESSAQGVFNLSDDLPASLDEVVRYAADLIGVEPPAPITWDDPRLSPMARSFFSEDRRVGNKRLESDLRISLRFPTYRTGLASIAGADLPLPDRH